PHPVGRIAPRSGARGLPTVSEVRKNQLKTPQNVRMSPFFDGFSHRFLSVLDALYLSTSKLCFPSIHQNRGRAIKWAVKQLKDISPTRKKNLLRSAGCFRLLTLTHFILQFSPTKQNYV
ncbi:MAG TPA: hypothetical protein VF458_20280, partial [Ktedonobacteraceae bacterium]